MQSLEVLTQQASNPHESQQNYKILQKARLDKYSCEMLSEAKFSALISCEYSVQVDAHASSQIDLTLACRDSFVDKL